MFYGMFNKGNAMGANNKEQKHEPVSRLCNATDAMDYRWCCCTMKQFFQVFFIVAISLAHPCYAESPAATLHEYQGEMTIQSVAGKSCLTDAVGKRLLSLIWRKAAGGGVEGYFDGERLNIGRFSGKQLGALAVIYPHSDGLAQHHHMSIQLEFDVALTGSLHETPPEQDDGKCYITAATLDMKERPQQDVPANRWQQATDNYDFAIAQWQYKQYGESIMPLQKMLTSFEYRQQRTEKETAFMAGLRTALNKHYPKLLSSSIERVRLAAEQGDVLAQFELAKRLAPDDAPAAFDWLARARINASFTAAQCSDTGARAVVGMARLHYAGLLDTVAPPQEMKRWDWIRAEMPKAMRKALKDFHETPRLPLSPWICSERLPEKEIRAAQVEIRKRMEIALNDRKKLHDRIGKFLDRDDLLTEWEELPLKREAWLKLDKLIATLPPGQISGYERGLTAHRSGDIQRANEIWHETVLKQTAPDENSACLAWEYLTEDRPDAGLYARKEEIESIAKQARSRIGQPAADALSDKLTAHERAAILAELSSMKRYDWSRCRDRAWRPPALKSAGLKARIPEVLLNEAEWVEYQNHEKRDPEEYRNIINTYRAAGQGNAIGRTHAARLEERYFPEVRWAGILEDYRLSAEAGHRRAMIFYADALELGDTYQAADIPAAIAWYRKAVDTIPADVRKPWPAIPKGYRDRDKESDLARQRLSAYAKAGVVKFTAEERLRYLTDEELLPKNCAALRNDEPPKLPVSPNSVAVIDSQLWLKPNNCEVNVRVEIERPQQDRLVQHVIPNWGGSTYPELLNFFMFCVAGHYGTQYGYSHMRIVIPKEQLKGLSPAGSFGFQVLLEKKDTGKQGEITNAAGETFSESFPLTGFRSNCSKMLADEVRW